MENLVLIYHGELVELNSRCNCSLKFFFRPAGPSAIISVASNWSVKYLFFLFFYSSLIYKDREIWRGQH